MHGDDHLVADTGGGRIAHAVQRLAQHEHPRQRQRTTAVHRVALPARGMRRWPHHGFTAMEGHHLGFGFQHAYFLITRTVLITFSSPCSGRSPTTVSTWLPSRRDASPSPPGPITAGCESASPLPASTNSDSLARPSV
ncbi:hypothetical protein D3C71_1833300 [compost metagenome]